MTPTGAPSRQAFAAAVAAEVASGKHALLLAPLGSGKTHTLLDIRRALSDRDVPFVFLDLFTAASTPERLLALLAGSVSPFMEADAETIRALAEEGAKDRHQSSAALLALLDLLATHPPSKPFVWLVDEVTEIRSLAYFPELGHVERPFARALAAARGAVLTSSYLALATDLFEAVEPISLPGLTADDLVDLPSLRSDGGAIAKALAITHGAAGTLLPLVADMRDTRDLARSLVSLLRPGGTLEIACRRHYELLVLRSRGYAVAKRAAEAVAQGEDRRLTDLFPEIGRTAGASRQYLRWLVEVGLLVQVRKRYRFADPIVGLWAALYLGRGDLPVDAEIRDAVAARIARLEEDQEASAAMDEAEPAEEPIALPKRRVDRFEEID
jgi:hypothetical protein